MPLLFGLAAALAPPMVDAAPSAQARVEIAKLIAVLGESRCQFQRNGRWHDPAEARAHLQRKYDYLLEKDKVDSAEEFIARVASGSSLSGRAYRVKCGKVEQASSAWFLSQLQRLRHTAGTR